MRRSLRSTTMIFAQSQSSVGSRPDYAGAKFALSSNSSASTRNPKFIAGFFYSSPSFSSSSLRGPNLLSWFVVFAVAVETLHYRLDWRAFRRRRFLRLAAPPPASRRALHRAARTQNLDNPLQAMGELRAAVFDRHATGVGHSLGSAADRGRAAS